MVVNMLTGAIILLATYTVAGTRRIRPYTATQQDEFEEQLQITEQNHLDNVPSIVHAMSGNTFKHEATSTLGGAQANSAGERVSSPEAPGALVQEAVSQGSVFSSALNVTVKKQLDLFPNVPLRRKRRAPSAEAPPSSFSKTLDYVRRVPGGHFSRIAVLRAACDSKAFSCKEIIELTNGRRRWNMMEHQYGIDAVVLFAEARQGKGCISDPANAKSVADTLDGFRYVHWHEQAWEFLEEGFLKPATDVWQPAMQLELGRRPDKDMRELLDDLAELELIKTYKSQGSERLGETQKLQFIKGQWVGGLYQPGSPSVEEFEKWLKQMRSGGEQFSGPQLVSLVQAIPNAPVRGAYYEQGEWKGRELPEMNYSAHEKYERNSGTAQAASVLLQYLEQYVTGVSCEEVKQIIQHMVWVREDFFLEGLDALKSNIADGQNKVDIVAFIDSFGGLHKDFQTTEAELVLHDVGIGLPPKNNPVFGVLKGNPVILVVDESTSMNASFTLGDDTLTLQKFCNRQLETALQALPNGTYFNIIQYSSSALNIFQKPVLASKANIKSALDRMGVTWRHEYSQEQDPIEMIKHLKVFALKVNHRLNRTSERKSLDALQLAYASADLPPQQTVRQRTRNNHQARPTMHRYHLTTALDFLQFIPKRLALVEQLPQIYFLTSGQPDGGTSHVLDKIDEFDRGRSIPVNSIALMTSDDLAAKQFVKALARKTDGFFRSIAQASEYTHKSKQETMEHHVNNSWKAAGTKRARSW